MSNGLIIPENLMALSHARVTAGSEASATMADDNLLTEEPSEFWRSSSNTPDKTLFNLSLNGYFFSANALALAALNLYRGDEYRVRVSGSPFSMTSATIWPAKTKLSSTNCGSLISTLTGGFTPGGTWCVPSVTGTNWDILVDFTSAGVTTLASGSKTNAFWMFVKASGTPSFAGSRTRVSCDVYEDVSGTPTLRANLGYKYITSTVGQWLFFSFDSSLIVSGDARKVQCKVSFNEADGAFYSSMDNLTFERGLAIAALPSGSASNGWKTFTPFLGSGINYYPEAHRIQGQYIYEHFGRTVTDAQYITVEIRSDHAPTNLVDWKEILPTPPGYVQCGCAVAGEIWSPTTDRGHGPYIGTTDLSSKGITDGGQVFGSRRPVLRNLSWPMTILSKEEGGTILTRVLLMHGVLKKFFVHLAPGDSVENESAGFMATLKNAEHMMSTTPAKEGNRAVTLEFVEAL